MTSGANISTGENSGEAQIFKPVDLSYLDKAAAIEARNRRYNQQLEQKRSSDFNKGVGSLHDLDIFYRDQPYFAQKQKELYDWAASGNATKIIKNGDPAATMEFQKKLADLQTEAKLSKNVREQSEAVGKTAAEKGFGEYVPGAEDYYHQFNAPIDPEKMKNGEKPDWNFDVSKFRKDIPPTKILEELKKLKQDNVKTGGGYVNDKGETVNYTTESFPRDKADKLVSAVATNPEYYDKFHRMLNALPDKDKSTYKKADGSLDVLKYAQDWAAPNLVVQPQTISHLTKGSSDNGLRFGNGMATTGKYNFVSQDRQKEEPSGGIIDKITGKKTTVPYKVISIQRTDAGENKGFFFDDPDRQGKKTEVVPKEYEQDKNGDWFLIGVPKDGGKEIKIPEKKVTSDMKAITGVDLDELLKGGKKDEVIEKSKEVAKPKHKKGDIQMTREGKAVFNGTKWVLEK